MDYKEIIHRLINELSFRVGIPDLKDKEQQAIISEILSEWGNLDEKKIIMEFLTEAEPEKSKESDKKPEDEKYVNTGGKGYIKKTDQAKYKQQGSDFEGDTFTKEGPGVYKVADKKGSNSTTEKETGTALNTPEYQAKVKKEKKVNAKIDDEDSDSTKEVTDEVVSVSAKEKVKELYNEDGKGPLIQNSKTSDMALEKGYVRKKPWVAPGNAGSNYNENMSNEGLLILEKYPDISEAELSSIIFEKTKDTKLGKQQNEKTSLDSEDKGKVPKGIPTTKRGIYRCAIIAARSARSKSKRAKAGIKAATSQVGFGTQTIQSAYGGTKPDLDNLLNEIDSAKEVFIYDDGTDTVYTIPKDKMKEWISNSGGGENASDTVVLTKDKNGNLLYDGWSDKKGLGDLQGNSTLNDDFTKADKQVDILTKSGKVSEEVSGQAKSIISKAKLESKKIEEGYQYAVYKEGAYLSGYEESKKDDLASILKQQDKGYDEAGTKNHMKDFMKKTGTTTHREALDKLLEGSVNEKLTGNERKLVNRLADVHRKNIKDSGGLLPSGLDTKQILSDSRDQALARQRQTVNELNELTGKTESGKEKPLGDMLGFQETIDFLHLDKMDEPKDENDIGQILKRNTHLVMAGIDVPPNNIKECLGVDDLNDYEDNFEIVQEERIYKDRTGKYTTGKVVYIYAISKEGKSRKFVGEKVYRSKDGPTGKTNNTIAWSPEMQSCFDSKK